MPTTLTYGAAVGAVAFALCVSSDGARAQSASQSPSPAAEPSVLRICGDPDNLPFSNEKQEGFENKIAEVLAKELGDSVAYVWWPHRRGFVRNTLRASTCDVIVGVPGGFDPVSSSTPYYRSTYYMVSRADRKLSISSLDDPQLATLRVGVNIIGEDYTNTPPAQALAKRSVPHITGYSTFYDDEHRPGDIIDGVAKGDIDVAFVWGPLAGYYASRASVPLSLVALPDSDVKSGMPFAFDVTLGVRRKDKELKTKLEEALRRRAGDIREILATYHVPTLPRP